MAGARDWWRSSKYNLPAMDLHLCLFVELLRCFRTFIDEANPESEEKERSVDYYALSEKFDQEVEAFEAKAETLFAEHSDRSSACIVSARAVRSDAL